MDWQWDRTSSVLLQNCDLPPPLKLFSPFHLQNKQTTTPKIAKHEAELEPINQAENTSLLRALRLSQSRAREAEKKAAAASACNVQMAALIIEESLRLSAHRQWVRLREMEILLLQKNKMKSLRAEEGDDVVPALTWCLTLALCLGIGFALGRYML